VLHSAHDIAEGGVAVALAEACIAGGIGATVALDTGTETLFAEGVGGFVVSGDEAALRGLDCEVEIVGTVGGNALRLGEEVEVPLAELTDTHRAGLAPYFP
jgi:phosphoribosylformylglycinamidine synthase